MYQATKFLLFSIIFYAFKTSRFVNGYGCLTNQNDTTSQSIKDLYDAIDQFHSPRCRNAIDRATCQLVGDTRYTVYFPREGEEFDFIVVGGGTAGSVVASRLSENGAWRVLLLEAGGVPTLTTEIPGFSSKLGPELIWPYTSVPLPNSCQGNKDKSCKFTAGKVLGGSSMVNGMRYVRGHPSDFDNWESMGNPGWGYKHLLPYFKKSENIKSIDRSNPEFFKYHGVNGLLGVELFETNYKFLGRVISDGFEQLGYNYYNDVNAQFHEGNFEIHGTLKNKRRDSTAKAFLHGFQSRRNLRISINSLVTKILINRNKIAYSVQFMKKGRMFTVRASKEVILCAGVIRSPHLLMLSGVGPAEHLRNMNIDVISNLPVGFNLHDHTQFLGYLINTNIQVPKQDPVDNTYEFLVNCRGFLADNPVSLAQYIKSSRATYPDVQVFVGYIPAQTLNSTEQLSFINDLNEGIKLSIKSITSSSPALVLGFILLRPRSRGRILLNTTNPQDYPLIFPQLLTAEDDILLMLEMIQFLDRLTRTPSFQSTGSKRRRLDIPECNRFQFRSEAYWRCIIRYMGFSYLHGVGTCKMGPRGSRDSVVDPRLRVIGIRNLRVADASIMPVVTSGNTMAPVIAIAEKAADLIKESWI